MRHKMKKLTLSQHYPPGTHENYNSFSSGNLIMGKSKELEFSEGRGGCQGSATQPPVPPTLSVTVKKL